MPTQEPYTIIYLPPESPEWSGLLAQFTMAVAAREGRPYASWAGERLSRTSSRCHGVAALADGHLLGLTFFEEVDDALEITFPWTTVPDREVARDLTAAALQVIREEWPSIANIRVERQLLPDRMEIEAVEGAGFECYWRKRMSLELDHWDEPLLIPPGYRLAPWNIRQLDAAAGIVCEANRDTLDARLYASFFGKTARDCRHGLLGILAGKFGPIHPLATICAFQGQKLVGVNLVIAGDSEVASVIEISIDPAYQGKGLGRALMVASMLVLKDDRFARAELAVTAANIAAYKLYQSLGFEDVGEFAVCVLPADGLPE